jgi:hypothetical protein
MAAPPRGRFGRPTPSTRGAWDRSEVDSRSQAGEPPIGSASCLFEPGQAEIGEAIGKDWKTLWTLRRGTPRSGIGVVRRRQQAHRADLRIAARSPKRPAGRHIGKDVRRTTWCHVRRSRPTAGARLPSSRHCAVAQEPPDSSARSHPDRVCCRDDPRDRDGWRSARYRR